MQKIRHLFAAVVTATLLVSSLPPLATAQHADKAASTLRAPLQALTARQHAGLPKSFNTREVLNGALLTLVLGQGSAAAENDVRHILKTQRMNPGDSAYGQFPVLADDRTIRDPNQTVFIAQTLSPLVAGYSSRLSPAFRNSMRPHIAALIAALKRRNVGIDYTNIYLAKNVSLLLLAEAARDASAASDARSALGAWAAQTNSTGIHEFDSPPYYATDLDSLVEGYRYAASADKPFFKSALDYFWTDIAANFFEGATKLSGPYSRNYDFIRGLGGVDNYLNAVRWAKSFSAPNMGMVFLYDNARPGGYVPPLEIDRLAHSGPREIVSTWDADPHHIRRVSIMRNVAIGCASGSYGPQDDFFTVAFRGDRRMSQIGIFVTSGEDPYGLALRTDAAGIAKPAHLPAAQVCVEDRGAALLTMDLDAAPFSRGGGGLTTSILFPADATVSKPQDGIVTASLGGGSVALRIVSIDDANGRPPSVAFANDKQGLAHHTLRLAITHLQPGERTKQHHLRIVLLALADDNAASTALAQRIAAASVQQQNIGDAWRIAARIGGTRLEIDRSLTDIWRIYDERVDGAPLQRMPLGINGVRVKPISAS